MVGVVGQLAGDQAARIVVHHLLDTRDQVGRVLLVRLSGQRLNIGNILDLWRRGV